jgi:hypothetical protein
MSRSGKKERKTEARSQRWKEWRRGNRGFCGGWFTWRFTVFFVFGLCIATGLLLVFLLPRVPSFGISQDAPLAPATGDWNSSIPTQFSSTPANFSFPAFAQLQLNTGSNFIPLKFTYIGAIVFDLDTSVKVGTGDLYDVTFPAKKFSNLEMPLNFSYVADNRSDITWANWYNGCKILDNSRMARGRAFVSGLCWICISPG